MQHILKIILTKIALACTLTLVAATSLTAQNNYNFIYTHQFQQRQFDATRYTPSSASVYWPSSSPFQSQNKDYSFPSNPRPNYQNIPQPTRLPTSQEYGLLSFNKVYLSAYASRLEKPSGSSLEDIIINRNNLIQQGEQADVELMSLIDKAEKWAKDVTRGHCNYYRPRLHQAINLLKEERTAFLNDLEQRLKDEGMDEMSRAKHRNNLVPFRSATAEEIILLESHQNYLKGYGIRLEKNSGASLEEIIANRNSLIQEGEEREGKLARLAKRSRRGPDYIPPYLKNLRTAISILKEERDAFVAELEQKHQEEEQSRQEYEEQLKLFQNNWNTFHREAFELSEILKNEYSDEDKTYNLKELENLRDFQRGVSSRVEGLRQDAKAAGISIDNEEDFISTQEFLEKAGSFIENLDKDNDYTDSQYLSENIFDVDIELDGSQIAQKLEKFNKIFTGEQTPDIETFDNLIGSFLRGKSSNADTSSTANASLGPDAFGDYVLTSAQYRDEAADVSMEIGRLVKTDNNCNDNLDTMSEDPLFLKNVRISEENESVTFAFYREGEKILVKSDITSMENFVDQKHMEEYVFLNPTYIYNRPKFEGELPISYDKTPSPSFLRTASSVIADFLPFIGTGKSITELIYGYDHIAGQPVSRIVAAFGLVGSVVPIPGAKAAGKFVGKGVNHITGQLPAILQKKQTRFVKSGYTGGSHYYAMINNQIVHAGEIISKLESRIQEQLKNIRIPNIPLVPGGGLLVHELLGGHTIDKHVGKNTEYLIERSLTETARKSGEPRHYSTFKNLEKAEYFVTETIKKNQEKIQEWLKTGKRSKKFESPFKQTTGKLLKEGEQSTTNVQGVRIILKPAKETPEGYIVLTAFPIE